MAQAATVINQRHSLLATSTWWLISKYSTIMQVSSKPTMSKGKFPSHSYGARGGLHKTAVVNPKQLQPEHSL